MFADLVAVFECGKSHSDTFLKTSNVYGLCGSLCNAVNLILTLVRKLEIPAAQTEVF